MTKFILALCGVYLVFAFQAAAPAQTITNQPQSITVNNASTATFTVGASNALTYQWQFDGSNIGGATNSVLTLEDVMTNEEGSYTVVVGSSNTVVTSSPPAMLTVTNGTVVRFIFSGLLPSASSNTMDVQLFDHDKPATVENFLHYVRAGGYTNMFFDRCYPDFVLQGGDDGASNQTSTTPPLTGWTINSEFTTATNQSPPYPQELNNESGIGPVIHNRFGTIAMALSSNSNSANSAFFFNLIDNSANLDSQAFTVFGRIIDANGTNVLQYFNQLSVGQGGVTDGEILLNGQSQPQPVPDLGDASFLPVDYIGTNAPANANLVFCNFSFPDGAPVADTTPPTIAITNPPNTLLTNSLQGTASDNVALADVFYYLTPQGTNGTFPSPYTNGATITNFATGTTNWSISLSPGVYNVSVLSQDGAGNLSAPANVVITNTAIVVVGNGSVSFTNAALTNANPVGFPLQPGSNYGVQAVPGSNQTFVSWSSASYTSTDPAISFTYEGDIFTATFISNDIGGISFTSPSPNAMLSNTLFNITGVISTSVLTLPVTVTCQIFTNTALNQAVTLPQSTTTSTTTWSVGVTNYLATGSYFIQALATDKLGNTTLITENFSFTADTTPPVIAITNPAPNAVLFLGGPLLLQGTVSGNVIPLTSVTCTLVPVTNADGTAPNDSESFTDAAVGTTNWSLDLNTLGYIPPGEYMFTAQVQDVAGNVGVTASQSLTISGILTNGDGTVTLTQGAQNKGNPIGYPLQYGVTYGVQASAAAGYTFVNWNINSIIVPYTPWTNFTYYGGLLTATFVRNNTLNGKKDISITYPKANARLTTNSFQLQGKVAANGQSAQITCQISSLTTGMEAGPALTTSGTTTWSVPVTNLPPDDYLIQAVATNASGFSTVISEGFAVLGFKDMAGIYNGLFICTTDPVAPTNSGLITLTLTDSGVYSARLFFPAYAPAATEYFFSANGAMESPYAFFQQNPIKFSLSLDLTNGTDTITGTISGLHTPWSSEVLLYRAATKLSATTTPALGKYVLNLGPTNWPTTNGCAALSVGSSGSLAVSGALPDGAAFSQSVRVSTNGVWPLCVVPTGYKTNGMLIGWETNQASGSCSGQLTWYKAGDVGAYYTNGVNTNMNTTGAKYLPPAAGNYSIIFQGGTISTPVTNQLVVTRAGGQFKPVSPTDKLAISLSSSGVLTGHFLNKNSNKTVQFKGAFFGQSQGGSGFILDGGGQAGYFSLEAQ